MRVYTINDKSKLSKTTPNEALQELKDGNIRFVNNKSYTRDFHSQISLTADGQYPFAIILSCIDSRIPTEVIFDQGIGDLFNTRIAGNVISNDVLGSMEFACKISGAKLILVLGHTKCGAVQGACSNIKLGKLSNVLSKLKPAVLAIQTEKGRPPLASDADFVDAVAQRNVEFTIEHIIKQSNVISEMIAHKEIIIAGAMYNVASGEVTF